MTYEKHKSEILSEHERLMEVIANDRFFAEWLADSEQERQEIASDQASQAEQEIRANALGYANVRIANHHWDHAHWVLTNFVKADACKALWDILKAEDRKKGGFSYSPTKLGFPLRVMNALEDWYREPKFTAAERKTHHKKIIQTCDELLDLIAPVKHGHQLDKRFTAFSPTESVVGNLLESFASPKTWSNDKWRVKWLAASVLERAGLTPEWAINAIRRSALNDAQYVKLPTKLRAKGAMKTFLISRLWRDLESVTYESIPVEQLVSQDLFAQFVGIVARSDCSTDDIRKVLSK